jgi:hypothetical protein
MILIMNAASVKPLNGHPDASETFDRGGVDDKQNGIGRADRA